MRVALAEDSVLLRDGLARLLGDAGLRRRRPVRGRRRADAQARSYAVDIVIVDIRLPPTHTDEGLRAALEIRERYPDIGVLVLSQYVELGLAMKLLADSAEGTGYLLKDRISDVAEFVDAVRRVAGGGSAIDPRIVSTLLSRQRSRRPARRAHPARARGARADGDAAAPTRASPTALVISVGAVEKYVSSIFGKLGLPSTGSESRRVLAVLLFLRA